MRSRLGRKLMNPNKALWEKGDFTRSEDLKRQLYDLFNRQNRSPVADATLIPATYLRVTVAR
jgi:hypothetical protein